MKPTLNRSKDILRALMDPATPDLIPWTSQELKSMLQHQMKTTLNDEREFITDNTDSTPEEVESIISSYGDRTFNDLLVKRTIDDVRPVAVIKDFAKSVMHKDADLPKDIGRVIYIMTILLAINKYDVYLTNLDKGNIIRQARRCLTFAWLPDDIRTCISRDLAKMS